MITLHTTASESYRNCMNMIARCAPTLMRAGDASDCYHKKKKPSPEQRAVVLAKLARGWHQEGAAHAAGVSKWAVQQIVKGMRHGQA